MNRIKKAREAKGISQKEVSLTLGVSAPTVSEWESGKKFPSTENLVALARLLETTTDYLLCESEPSEMPDSEFSWLDKLTADEIAEKCYEDFKILFSRSNKSTHAQMKGFYVDTYKRFKGDR